MTSLMRVLLCFALFSTCAWGATIQASTQYDLSSSSGGCCPSGFDQSTVQVTPTETTAQAAVSRSNYARASAVAEFSTNAGIRLGAYSYAHISNSFDASIGGAATWAGVQAQASFFDNITVLSGPSGSLQWVFALHGTLTSSPGGCGVISVWPYDLCSAHLRLYRQTQGAAAEAVATFSAINGTRVIDQLVTINLPFTVGSGQSVGFGIYAATACDGLPLPPGRNCTSLSDFYNTAALVGFHVLDTQGNVVDNNVVLQSESGFDYFSVNVPEPSSFLLLLSGLVATGLVRLIVLPRSAKDCRLLGHNILKLFTVIVLFDRSIQAAQPTWEIFGHVFAVGGYSHSTGYPNPNQVRYAPTLVPDGVARTTVVPGISITTKTTPTSVSISYSSSSVDLGNAGFNAGYSGLKLAVAADFPRTSPGRYKLAIHTTTSAKVTGFTPFTTSDGYFSSLCPPQPAGSELSAHSTYQVFQFNSPYPAYQGSFSSSAIGRLQYSPLSNILPVFPPMAWLLTGLPENFSESRILEGPVLSADSNEVWVDISAGPSGYCLASGSVSYSGTITITTNPLLVTILDPVSALLNGTVITSDLTKLTRSGRIVRGVSADGTAQLVLRITGMAAGEHLRVRLPNQQSLAADMEGALRPLNSPIESRDLTVTAQGTSPPIAFAVFRAPMDFSDGISYTTVRERSLNIRVERVGDGTGIDVPVAIVRPPVVLVHGLWDSGAIWNSFTPLMTKSNKEILNVQWPVFNYGKTDQSKGTADHTFYENASKLSQYLAKVTADRANADNIALSKVDFVAHSMGGNLVRSLSKVPTSLTAQNYRRGYAHKLITIGTPHLGSPLALALITPANNCTAVRFDAQQMSPFNGAVADLAATVDGSSLSPALKSMAPLSFPTTMLAGRVSNKQMDNMALFQFAASRLCPNDPIVQNFTAAAYKNIVGEQHDGIVPVASALNKQRGEVWGDGASLGGKHSRSLGWLGISGSSLLDPASPIATRVVKLLNLSVTATEFVQ